MKKQEVNLYYLYGFFEDIADSINAEVSKMFIITLYFLILCYY